MQDIAHYQIGAKLGQGGMGEVYQATDTRLNRQVAIKLLPAEFSADPQRLARFEREAQLLAALNHPNIAAIYGLEKEREQLALILELVEGPTLAERIAAGPLTRQEALRIALQIAEALESAHDKGIIHRDLKPANIKLTPDGTVKVLDFGLAKALDDRPEQSSPEMTHSPTLTMAATQAGIILGTAAYMSPEQAKGATTDRRADVWSFGVVLWEMLTARQAFEAETISETLAAVMLREPDFSELPDTIPLRLQKLIERCLTKEPRQRLQAIGEARIAIEQTLAGTQEDVEGAAAAAVAAPSKLPWILLAATALALFAAVASMALAPTPVPPRLSRFEINLGDLTVDRGIGRGSHFAISPDGSRIAMLASTEGEPVRLYIRRIDQLEFRPLPGTEGAALPTFSPDGRWAAFVADGRIKKVAVAGDSQPLDICEGSGSIAWSAGTIVFTGGGNLMRVPEGGGTPEVLAEFEKGRAMWVTFVPGTDRLLVTFQSDTFNIGTLRLSDPTLSPVIENGSWPLYVPTGHLIYAQYRDEEDEAGFTGGLLALPFDADSGTATGAPIPVQSDVRIYGGGASNFALSETGALLYWPGAGDPRLSRQLAWIDPSGDREIVDSTGREYTGLQLSAGGSIVAFESEGDIYLHRRGRATRLTFTENNDRPILSPDGSELAFASLRESEQTYPDSIWRKEADPGAQPTRLAATPEDRRLRPTSWSPDGRFIVYQASSSTDSDIWILPLKEGSEPRPLVATPFREGGAVISPDGRWLAFESQEAGSDHVFVQSFPEPGPRIQVSVAGGSFPRWSVDGQRLFFLFDRELTVADLDFSNGVEAERPELYLREEDLLSRVNGLLTPNYVIAPDGRVLIAASLRSVEDDDDQPPLRIILNFLEELKARTQ